MDLIVLLECVRAQVLHLLVDVDESDTLADVLLDLDQEVPVDVHELLHILRVFAGALRAVGLVLDFSLHGLLVVGKLLFYVQEEVFEELAVIHDELIDDSTVHVHAWKLVRVPVDDPSHPREVRRDLLRVSVDYQVVVAGDVLQEVAVVGVVTGERRELDHRLAVVSLLLPELQVIVRQHSELLSEILDSVDNLFDEYLEYRVRSGEALTVFVALLLVAVIVLLEEQRRSVSCLWVG